MSVSSAPANPLRASQALRWLPWAVAGLLLALPAVAMRFTDEVDWNAVDFLVFGLMLAVACGINEVACRLSVSLVYRLAAAVAIGTGFLVAWANLAVGIIGSEDAPVNLAFFGVLAIGLAGAFVVRGRARGMVRVMALMALAQVGVSVVAWLAGLGGTPPVAGVFVLGWLVAGWLFLVAGRAAGGEA